MWRRSGRPGRCWAAWRRWVRPPVRWSASAPASCVWPCRWRQRRCWRCGCAIRWQRPGCAGDVGPSGADDLSASLARERDAALRAQADAHRFVATASHDLRQPMHALGLFVSSLERRVQGTPEASIVRNMTRSIEALDQSFGAMLDISRLEAGSMEVNLCSISRCAMSSVGCICILPGWRRRPGQPALLAGRQVGAQRPAVRRAGAGQSGAERAAPHPRGRRGGGRAQHPHPRRTSRSGTPAAASRPRSCRASSTSSIRSARAPGAASVVWAWAWRSCAGWCG